MKVFHLKNLIFQLDSLMIHKNSHSTHFKSLFELRITYCGLKRILYVNVDMKGNKALPWVNKKYTKNILKFTLFFRVTLHSSELCLKDAWHDSEKFVSRKWKITVMTVCTFRNATNIKFHRIFSNTFENFIEWK